MITMQTINNIERKFKVFEDNDGGLILFIWNESEDVIVFAHSGYEYNQGSLCQDLDALAHGEDPEYWEGNEEYLIEEYHKYYWTCEEIVNNDGIYYEKMCTAGHYEFCPYCST